jgi:hypothetical protein
VSPEQAAFSPGRDALARAPAPVETANQVVDRYVQALGGSDALREVTTLVMRGTSTRGANEATPLLVEEMAPDRYRATAETTPPVSRAVDGANGWIQGGNAGRMLHGVERQALAVSEQLGLPLRVKEYGGLTVVRYDRLDGHDVILLEGGPSPTDAETLYFDRKSNLLLRRVARLQTPMGRLPVQIDYADYRDVGRIKVPFEVRTTDWESAMKIADEWGDRIPTGVIYRNDRPAYGDYFEFLNNGPLGSQDVNKTRLVEIMNSYK